MFKFNFPKGLFFFFVLLNLLSSCSSGDDSDGDEGTSTIDSIEGFYTGSLQLTLSGDDITVPVSLTVNESSTNKFAGDYFETNDFMACCSTNGKDGTFDFDYDPDTMTIDNFVIRVDFNIDPSNPCTGTYTGSGSIESNGNTNQMMAQIIVDDCNVSSTPAVLSLTQLGGS
ncbi:MAG: hypothetical protein AAF969_18100 [Bacteroidota bacterium]